jgi:hypothetical protein
MLVLAMQLCAPVPVIVRHGLTTINLVRSNLAPNIDPGAFADEAGPPTGIHRSKAMSRTKQRHAWSGILAIGALVLTARAGMVKAGSRAAPTEAYRATEVIAIDPDRDAPGSAARLRFVLRPGEQAALATEEGQQMVLVCGAGAATMEVTHANARS